MEQNRDTYLSSEVIKYYENYEGLQKPEQTVLEILKDRLSEMSMLDIGIGAGRTTNIFAPLVKKYLGVDYSEGMVNACVKKFGARYSNAKYETCDVRDLSKYEQEGFDFVLFSFNGIDSITYEERKRALNGIRKIINRDGYFCFSTHNSKSLENISAISFRLNVFAMVKRIFDVRKIKRINKEQLSKIKTSKFVSINDGAHNFSLSNGYIDTAEQLRLLKDAGFVSVQVFSLVSGKLLTTETEIYSATDKWLYFLCR